MNRQNEGQARRCSGALPDDQLPGRIIQTYTPPGAFDQAARKLAARFGLTLSVALVIADLAGLGGAHG